MNYLKNQIIKELPLEISNKSIETTNPNSLTLLKEHIRSLESEIYFLRDKLRVKSDLIKLLLSSKSAETPVTIQTPDNVDPKNPLNGIQKEKKNANKNSINDLISISLDTRKSNLTEINNDADKFHIGNYLSSPDTNKHQTDITNKTAPKLSSAMPPPLPTITTITTTAQPPPSWELESDELPTDSNKNGIN